MQARRRLIKNAAGESAVTYAMIMDEASLDKDVSKRVVEETLKAEGVRYRPARRKIYLTKKDAQVRKAWAQRMIRRPARYWACLVDTSDAADEEERVELGRGRRSRKKHV